MLKTSFFILISLSTTNVTSIIYFKKTHTNHDFLLTNVVSFMEF